MDHYIPLGQLKARRRKETKGDHLTVRGEVKDELLMKCQGEYLHKATSNLGVVVNIHVLDIYFIDSFVLFYFKGKYSRFNVFYCLLQVTVTSRIMQRGVQCCAREPAY